MTLFRNSQEKLVTVAASRELGRGGDWDPEKEEDCLLFWSRNFISCE